MADRYLLESGSPDGYLLEDGSGVLLLDQPVDRWVGSPSSFGPIFWYENDPTTFYTDSGTTPVSTDNQSVQQINNKGSGPNLRQTTVGQQPVYRTAVGPNAAYLQFTAANSTVLSSLSTIAPGDSTGQHFFAFSGYFNRTSAREYLAQFYDAGGNYVAALANQFGVPSGATDNTVFAATTDTAASITTGVPQCLIVVVTASTIEVFINGVSDGPTAASGTRLNSAATLFLGAESGVVNFWDGKLLGFVQAPGLITANDIASLNTYMAGLATASGATVALTGQSLSGAIGSVLAAASLALSGGALGVSQGNVQQGAPITGQAVAVAQGTTAASVTVALTGQSLSVGQGSVGVGRALTGQSASVAQGATAPVTSVALIGQALSVARGTVAPATANVLTGQSATVAQGSLVATQIFGLTGQTSSVAQGGVAQSNVLALTGIALTVARGSVTAGADATASLTGQSLSLAQGTVAQTVSVALTGQALTAARGTLTPGTAGTITGQAAGVALGLLAPAASVAVSGQSLTASRGTVTVAGASNVTAALTGQSLGAAQGVLAPATSLGIAGQPLSVAQGLLSAAPRSVALTGQSVSIVQGAATASFGPSLSGQSTTVSSGSVTLSVSPSLAGQLLSVAQGVLATRPSVTYPLAGIGQAYPGTAVTYPITVSQAYPQSGAQTYPLGGISQHYPFG